MSGKLILRETRKSYETPCRILCERAGYELMDVLPQDERPIQSKGAWLKQGVRAAGALLRDLGRVRKADTIVLIGNYMSLFVALLNKLRVVRPRALYWWGFQIRGEGMQKLLKAAFRFLYSGNLRFVVFSRYEKGLYHRRMGLKEDCFLPIPYGDWSNLPEAPCGEEEAEPCYFSGGYSNRDYAALIRAWKNIDRRLVIIGSKNNADLLAYSQNPDNPHIQVLMDTPSDVFDRCLRRSKACILPFRANTGASGQTVAIRCRRPAGSSSPPASTRWRNTSAAARRATCWTTWSRTCPP